MAKINCECENGAVSSQGMLLRVYDPVTGERHEVCGLTNINGPQTTRPEVDATTLCSPAREYIGGLKDNGTLTATAQTRIGTQGQRIIRANLDSDEKLRFEMVLPDDGLGNGEVIAAFSGLVVSFPIQGAVDQVVTSEISIRISGDVTWDFPYVVTKTLDRLIQGETKNVTLTFSNDGEAVPGISVMLPQNSNFVELSGTSQTLTTDSAGAVNLLLTVKTGGAKTLTAVIGERVVEIKFESTVPARTMTSDAANMRVGVTVPVNFTVTEALTAKATATPAPAGVKITLAADTAFRELAGGPVDLTTDAAGQFLQPLTPLASGARTIAAGVYGVPVSVPAVIEVAVPDYAMSAAPTSMTQDEAETVVFSFTDGGVAVPAGMLVMLPIDSDFLELSAPQSLVTDAAGQVSSELTPIISGTVSLSATIESKTLSVDFTVAAA